MSEFNIQQQSNSYALDEFLAGMQDAKDGKPHASKSKSYDAGYGSQYELEQALSHKGVN